MTLTPRELAKPYLQARAADHAWSGTMTRIEASFYHGRLEEMQQWLDSGVLAPLMRREKRTAIAYHDILPKRLLEGAAARLLDPPSFGPQLTPAALRSWWSTLTKLRTKEVPSPISDWLYHAAVLPLELADEWVAHGASPHALARDDRRSPSSPFLRLLTQALRMRTHTHGTQGWPSVADCRKQLSARLDAWGQLPGMSPEQATQAMLPLVEHVFGSLAYRAASPAYEARMERLREGLIAHGAGSSNELIHEIVLPAIAPVEKRPLRPGAAWQLDARHNQREENRASQVHQGRVQAWVERLASLPGPEDVVWKGPWHKDRTVLSKLMALPNGDRVIGAILDRIPEAWKTVEEGRTYFFHPDGKQVEPTERAVSRLRNLAKLVGHPHGPDEKWCADRASECIRQHSLLPQPLVEAWLDCVKDPKLQQQIADTWFRCVPFVSSSAIGVEDTASQVLSMLHARNLLGFLVRDPSHDEGSVLDLNAFTESNGHRWLSDEMFARVLHALPGPQGARARALQVFYFDDTSSPEHLAQLATQSLDQSPRLAVPALEHQLQRLSDTSMPRRLFSVQQAITAIASATPAVNHEQCQALWEEFGRRVAPRMDVKSADLDLVQKMAEDLDRIAPLVHAPGEPMRQWCKVEQEQIARGYTQQDPTLTPRWQNMGVVLARIEALGADFSGLDQFTGTPLGDQIAAVAQRQQLQGETPPAPPRPRRRF